MATTAAGLVAEWMHKPVAVEVARGLAMYCVVVDVRQVFDRVDVKVMAPRNGGGIGQAWVSAARVTLVEPQREEVLCTECGQNKAEFADEGLCPWCYHELQVDGEVQ